MNRRNMLALLPAAVTGAAGSVVPASAAENPQTPDADNTSPRCLQYPRVIADLLHAVKITQSENLLEASYAAARTVLNKRTVWCHWNMGHTYRSDIFPERDGQPDIYAEGYDPEKSRDGDMLLLSFPFRGLDDLRDKKIFVVGGPSVWGGDNQGAELIKREFQEMRFRPYSNIWIETNMTSIGPRVYLPGMTGPIGPVTGPVYMTLFWMMAADTCRILTIEGHPPRVKGDEPTPSGASVNWASLDRPLMTTFYTEIVRQLNLVGSELGNIRKVAGMAADAVLAGKNLYFYSRYQYAFASEAWGRRGGLRLAKGIWDGHIDGEKGDCVIMGVYRPDDPVDLANLREFRKRGMHVASVGAVAKGTVIPEGPAVHKESDAHAGHFIDAYGFFAIPGVERRVCPTSGIMNCTMLWAICIEIAEEIMRRTGGNTPVINVNGALEMSGEHYPYLNNMLNSRGY